MRPGLAPCFGFAPLRPASHRRVSATCRSWRPDPFFVRVRSNRASSARVGVAIPDASASRVSHAVCESSSHSGRARVPALAAARRFNLGLLMRQLTGVGTPRSSGLRGPGVRFEEVILTAPDIDADVFSRDIAPRLQATNSRITMYASSKDKALMASKKFHHYARAGDSGSGLVVVPGVDTIDATKVNTSFWGHSPSRSVISDMYYLLSKRTPRQPATRPPTTWDSPWGIRPERVRLSRDES